MTYEAEIKKEFEKIADLEPYKGAFTSDSRYNSVHRPSNEYLDLWYKYARYRYDLSPDKEFILISRPPEFWEHGGKDQCYYCDGELFHGTEAFVKGWKKFSAESNLDPSIYVDEKSDRGNPRIVVPDTLDAVTALHKAFSKLNGEAQGLNSEQKKGKGSGELGA